MRLALAFVLMGGPVAAQDDARDAMLDFYGAHGCTVSADSLAAAVLEGFDPSELQRLAMTEQALGTASAQGDYIVFGEAVCTIRLPEITAIMDVSDPRLRAQTSAVDAYPDALGCFLEDPFEVFNTAMGGDASKGGFEYIKFLAASIITGEARFYSEDPLVSPFGFQVTMGACATAPIIPDIRANHSYIADNFGEYIRVIGAVTPCDGGFSGAAQRVAAQIQGVDITKELDTQPVINAWLYFEYDLITMAAGWHEGLTGTTRGVPRPPLCYFTQ